MSMIMLSGCKEGFKTFVVVESTDALIQCLEEAEAENTNYMDCFKNDAITIVGDDNSESEAGDSTDVEPPVMDTDTGGGTHDHTTDVEPPVMDTDTGGGTHDHTTDVEPPVMDTDTGGGTTDPVVDHGGHTTPPTASSMSRDHYCSMHGTAGSEHNHTMVHSTDAAKKEEHMAAMQLLMAKDATHTLVKCGNWSDPSVWKNNRIPGDGAQVYIPNGLGVTYDLMSSKRLGIIKVDGFMDFRTNASTKMYVDTLVATSSSIFQIGTKKNPIHSNAQVEIIIVDNGPINLTKDPILVGRGLVLHGTSEIHGAKKKSFLTISGNAMRGDSQITVEGNTSNWKVGDELVIVGTHPFQGIKRLGRSSSEDEVRKIKAISGQKITLDSGLQFNHEVYPGYGFKSHVGNSSRNVTIRSENPNGTRGHFMIMHSPKAQIRYAEFRDLGRSDRRIPISNTNVIGRYSLHIHRTGAVGHELMSIVEGNAVINGVGWGIVHHDSIAAVNHNFVFNIVGSGIVAEAGSETGEWVGNLVTSVLGGPDPKDKDSKKTFGPGNRGIAYFAASRAVIQQRNIAANVRLGWDWEGRLGSATGGLAGGHPVSMKAFKFNPTPFLDHSGDTDMVQLIGFEGNRAYALGTIAVSTHREFGTTTNTVNEFRDLKAWRITGTGVDFSNYTWDYAFRDVILVGVEGKRSSAAFFSTKKSEGFSFVNVHVENFGTAYDYALVNFAGKITNFTVKNVEKKFSSDTERYEEEYQKFLSGRRSTDPRPKRRDNGKRYIPQAIPLDIVAKGSVTPISKPILTMDPSNPKTIKNGSHFYLKGTIRDSFGIYKLGDAMWWFSPDVNYAPIYRSKDLKVYMQDSGKDAESPLTVILPDHGVIKKDGRWMMPVTLWLADRFTAINHPYTIYLEVQGMDEGFLKQHEIVNYKEPTRDLNLYDEVSDY